MLYEVITVQTEATTRERLQRQTAVDAVVRPGELVRAGGAGPRLDRSEDRVPGSTEGHIAAALQLHSL